MIKFVNATPTTIVTGFHETGDADRTFEALRPILDGVIEEDTVEVIASHSAPTELKKKDNIFQVYLWSHLKGERKKSEIQPARLWGMTQFYKTGFYKPSNKGLVITSPEGIEVAEYFHEEKVLIILFDVCHYGDGHTDSITILTSLVEEFICIYYTKDGKITITKEELEAKRIIARQEAKKRAVTNLLNKMLKTKIKSLADAVEQANRTIASLMEQLISAKKTQDLNRIALVAYTGTEAESYEKMKDQFEQIKGIKGIIDYDIEGENLVYFTDILYFNAKDRRYLAGRYKISVNVNNSQVKFMNLDDSNKRKSVWGEKCQHPHVNLVGDGCLGNVADTLVQLIHQNEWCALAMMLVGYLEAVNLDDSAGKHYYYWDEVDADGKIIKRADGKALDRIYECHSCEKEMLEGRDTIITCRHCGERFCLDCYEYVNKYDRKVCKGCFDEEYTKCTTCGKVTHCDDMTVCHDCDEKNCYDCMEQDEDDEDVYRCKKCQPSTVTTAEVATVGGGASCPHCGNATSYNPEAALFCEFCGTTGCANCIQVGALPNGNTGYACTEHRA